MKNYLAYLAWAFLAVQAAAQNYPTGLAEPSAADKAWAAKNTRLIRSVADLRSGAGPQLAALPSRVVNVNYLPPVGRQAYGSCTSWAIVYYYKTWQEAREHGWTRTDLIAHPEHVMSPAFIFNLANAGNPYAGSAVSANYQYLMDYGVCSCALMEPNADPRQWPTEEQYLNAFPQRAKSMANIATGDDAGLLALKTHLAGGDLACFSMLIYNNFLAYPTPTTGVNNDVYYSSAGDLYFASGAASAGHEMCIIGYDDNKSWTDTTGTHKGAVLVVNSWGTTWGANLAEAGTTGFLWIAYDYFKAAAADVTIMEDRIGYQPKLTGAYHVSHGRAAEINIQLLAGDRDAPAWTMGVFPRTGGLRPIDATVAFDATDYATTETLSWWLQISDVSLSQPDFQPNATGEVSSFKVMRPDGTIWESPDTPVATVESNIVYAYAWANIGLMQRHKSVFDSYNPAISDSVWGDLDGDGDMDVFFVSTETSGTQLVYKPHLMRNEGGWDFVEVSSGLPAQAGGMALGDYDGDGLPDLVLNGTEILSDGNGRTITRLMRNEGQCQFRDSGIVLPNSLNRPAWIDYNNDGRLDLVLNKVNEYFQSVGLVVLLNGGNGVFVDSGVLLPNSKVFAWADYNHDGKTDLVSNGADYFAKLSRKTGSSLESVALPVNVQAEALAWGDVDNDGWLDLAICGYDESFKKVGYILRNNNGTLEPYATIPCVLGGGFDWGDVDNDGRADLCIWGDFGDGSLVGDRNIRTKIYRNNGGGSFTSIGYNLWDVGSVMGGYVDYVRFLDIDHDGDLDMAVCGPGRIPYPQPRHFYIYENAAAQKSGLNKTNTPPSVPTGMAGYQTTQGGVVTLAWSASTDAQTPAGGLTYDVRVGSNPGWEDILPANANVPLEGRHGRPAVTATALGFQFAKAPGKAFYWSLRAIDPAQGISNWTAPQLFVPKGTTAPGDVNADGAVDIADLVQTVRMSTGKTAVDLTRADRNGDGTVDEVDHKIMEAMLLGSTGPDARTLAERTIDDKGGTITTTGIQFGVPKGAFSAASTLTIEKVRGPDAAGGRISNTYRISGIPLDFTQPLTFRIRASQSSSGKVYGSLGEISYHMSAGMLAPGVRKVAATAAGGGDYAFTLPPATSGIKTAAALKPAGLITQGYKLTIDVDLDNHVAVWANSHFSISFDASVVDFAHITSLGTALEDAYTTLKGASGGSFDYGARTSWPMQVTVCKLDSPDKYGEYMSSKLGVNHGWMEINSDNIANHAEVRVTAMHEFFHMVQEFYDPRNFASRAVLQPEQLWLNDASSVWSEALVAPSGYVAPMENTYILAPFNGLVAGARGGDSKKAQNHGYGMASLMQWFVKNKTATVMTDLYKSIKAGDNSGTAIMKSGPTILDFTWYPDYLTALIKSEIIPFGPGDIANAAPAERQFTIAADTDIEKTKTYTGALPDVSGRLHMAAPNYSGLTDKHRLAIRLARDENNLLLRVLKSKAAQPTTVLGDGIEANGAWKYEVTGLNTLQASGGWRLLPLVSNVKATDLDSGKTNYDLKMAVVGEGTKAFTTRTIKETCYGATFPTFSFSGSLQGRGWAEWATLDIGYFAYYVIDVPALPPIDYKLTATASITGNSVTLPADSGGDYEVLSVSAIKYYKFEYWPDNIQTQPTTLTSTSGTFNFTLSRDSTSCGGTVYANYDVVRKRYDKDGHLVSQSTDPGMETAIVGLALMP